MSTAAVVNSGLHFDVDPNIVGELMHKAGDLGFIMFDVNVNSVRSKEELLYRFAQHLPAYFGRNWDALEECLRDLDVGNSRGILLVLRSADALQELPASERDTLLSILRATASFWEQENIQFAALLERPRNVLKE